MFGSEYNSRIVITCSVAIFVGILFWNFRKSSLEKSKTKKNDKNTKSNETRNGCEKNTKVEKKEENEERIGTRKLDIPKLNWVKVGQVEELYFYPMKSGRGKILTECKFTEYGISVENKGLFTLRDRMFLVYNEETLRFQTGRHYPTMILISLSAVDECKVKLEAVGMPSVVFSVPEKSQKSTAAIECSLWFGERVKTIDCGPEPAEWLSRFLTGTNSGLRLGYTSFDQRKITTGPWERISKVYETFKDEDTGLFSDTTSYMLMTSKSFQQLNERLETPIPTLQFRPNIVVSNDVPFVEDNWEWIKIGDSSVIRNVKPCPRCKMIKIDPKTSKVAKEEPMKTLSSFREQTDPKRISVDGKAPLMGIYCGLYVTGNVKIGDEVFVHEPEDTEHLNISNGGEEIVI